MAQFNPDVQNTNDPNYLGYSRPISAYEGDTSAGVALKGIANVLDAGLKATDFVVKQNIEDEVYKRVDKERDLYTGALEEATSTNPQAARATTPTATTPATTGQGPMDILATNKAPLPSDVRNFEGYAEALKYAKDSDRVSPTYYYGELRKTVKDLREKYPGWIPYIDETVSRISGVNPANAYASSLAGDLNKIATKNAAEQDHIKTLIRQNLDIRNAPQVYEAYVSGQKSGQEVLQFIADTKVEDADLARREAQRRERMNAKKETVDLATDDATTEVAIASQRYFRTAQFVGLRNGKTIQDVLIAAQTGTGPEMDSETAMKMYHSVKGQKQVARTEIWAEWSKPIVLPDGTKTTRITQMGGAENATKILDNGLQVFDQVADGLSKNRLDQVGYSMDLIKARSEDLTKNLMTKSPMANQLMTMKAFENVGGPEYQRQLFSVWMRDDVRKSVDTAKKFMIQDIVVKNSKDPRFENIQDPSQPAPTIKGSIEQINKEVKMTPKESAAVNNEFIKFVEQIGDPKTPEGVKVAAMRAAFDPKNVGLLNLFEADTRTADGRTIPGKHTIFKRMTNPGVSDAVFATKDATIIRNYTDWVYSSFGLDLFKRDIDTMQRIQAAPDVDVVWDPENHKFQVFTGKDINKVPNVNLGLKPTAAENALALRSSVNRHEILRAQETVARLNEGLGNISHIAKQTGDNVDTFLFKLLTGFGYDPSKAGGGTTIPEKMLKALKTSALPEGPESATEFSSARRMSSDERSPDGNLRIEDPKTGTKFAKGQLVRQDVSENVPTVGRALLETISGSEAPGYNIKYGGKLFNDFTTFPEGAAVIAKGPNAGKTSSAAGRYQFIKSTWNAQAKKLGLTDFSPESQDLAAWDLAKTAYARQNKGGNLEQDLLDPAKYNKIAKSLSSTWTSLPGGIETNRAGKAFTRNLLNNLRKLQDRMNLDEFDEAGSPTLG